MKERFQCLFSIFEGLVLARDHHWKIVSELIKKVIFGNQSSFKDNFENGMPFVIKYHLKLIDLGKMVKNL